MPLQMIAKSMVRENEQYFFEVSNADVIERRYGFQPLFDIFFYIE